MEHYDLVVIGAGPAGVTAALRARELGARRVALVERGLPGGTCTNDGCVPTRVLAKAARLMRESHQFAEYGLMGPLPEVDFAALIQRSQQVVYQLQEKKQVIDHLSDLQITPLMGVGTAQFTDPHTLTTADGHTLQADQFIIAAGGRPRRLDLPGIEHTLLPSDVWQMNRLPRSIIIVGAGATGCQLASIFEAFHVQVHLLDLAPRILMSADESVSESISSAFQSRGVEVLTGIGPIQRIERDGPDLRMVYQTASGHDLEDAASIQEASRTAELVMFSVGWPGNGDQLNLAAAGVALRGGYVTVNDRMQTNQPHIFAAGDITGRIMLVQTAMQQGRIAAENAVLGRERALTQRVVPSGGFTDPEYGGVGLTEAQAREKGEIAVATVPYADMDRAVIDDHTAGFCKLIVDRETHELVGAHVVGEQAVEVIQIAAATMKSRGHIEQLAEMEFAYPTFAAIIGVAARQIARDLNATPVAREWRTLSRQRIAEWERMDDEAPQAD
ncbi:MAG TPA: NAD(P)/FAD-dependent oxidoreductase [Aggregatilineales bacterium]|nr:NAD(P)/FAD-dependent oxidoreductase [Aggregatilineales bacterium]